MKVSSDSSLCFILLHDCIQAADLFRLIEKVTDFLWVTSILTPPPTAYVGGAGLNRR